MTSNLHTPEENSTPDRQGARIFKKGHLIIKSFHPSRKPIQTETGKKQEHQLTKPDQ
jgi:hypothetical protein